jgi:hypothetical protein
MKKIIKFLTRSYRKDRIAKKILSRVKNAPKYNPIKGTKLQTELNIINNSVERFDPISGVKINTFYPITVYLGDAMKFGVWPYYKIYRNGTIVKMRGYQEQPTPMPCPR